MAKTNEELAKIKAQIEAMVEGLDIDEIKTVISGLLEKISGIDKNGVSVNFQEDTVPVKVKDLSAGLRNY